jgi:hypothetical protein
MGDFRSLFRRYTLAKQVPFGEGVHINTKEVQVNSSNRLISFERAVEEFNNCIMQVPESLFLSPMDEWTPRDVIAHLIAWNGEMLKVCRGIQRGETPAYYADAPNDYRNLNARFVAEHDAQEKITLLHELEDTKNELINYLRALAAEEWDADHGVIHYRGGPATISRTIESLAGDYRHHTKEILAWLNLKQSV